jgi:hypothetical protein
MLAGDARSEWDGGICKERQFAQGMHYGRIAAAEAINWRCNEIASPAPLDYISGNAPGITPSKCNSS